MVQQILDYIVLISFCPKEFFEIHGTHLIISLISYTVRLDFLVVHSEHGSTADDIESSILLEELQRCGNIGKVRDFIEEDQRFSRNESHRRI